MSEQYVSLGTAGVELPWRFAHPRHRVRGSGGHRAVRGGAGRGDTGSWGCHRPRTAGSGVLAVGTPAAGTVTVPVLQVGPLPPVTPAAVGG